MADITVVNNHYDVYNDYSIHNSTSTSTSISMTSTITITVTISIAICLRGLKNFLKTNLKELKPKSVKMRINKESKRKNALAKRSSKRRRG